MNMKRRTREQQENMAMQMKASQEQLESHKTDAAGKEKVDGMEKMMKTWRGHGQNREMKGEGSMKKKLVKTVGMAVLSAAIVMTGVPEDVAGSASDVCGVSAWDASPKTAKAFPGNYFWFPEQMHVRIKHPDSGMYLGIEKNGINQNGARLTLQKYDRNNPLQVFYVKPVAKDAFGRIQYQIRVHGEENQILEVRNSSKDDFASVAQWQEHGNDCAKWYFYTETDRNGRDSAVCCIKNVNSGKLMNVKGGNGVVGNEIIQYHEDNTSSEVFYVERESARQLTVFSQTDSRWKDKAYGKGPGGKKATIGTAGCGILSYVNAVYYMTGNMIDPSYLADWSVKNGYRINGVGTSYGLYKAFADSCGAGYGFRYVRSASDIKDIQKDLQYGRTAILGVQGHLIACVGYEDGKYLILDSYPSSGRGTLSGYRWLTAAQFTGKLKVNTIRVIESR